MKRNQSYLDMKVLWYEYFFMLYFLSLCGNVFFETYLPTTIYVITALLFIMVYRLNNKIKCKIKKYVKKNMLIIMTTFILLFFAQYVVFGWNTVPGIINHICKFIVGAGFISYLGDRFRIVFLEQCS